MTLAQVDLSEHKFDPACEMSECSNPATHIARGCMDKAPVLMCDGCLDRGIELITKVVKMYMRLNKRVLICDDCHRPVINLDTHLDVHRI